MKRFLVAVAFGLAAIAAQAEATFDQIEGLIQQQQYSAAASGLEVIIQNHPKSAKAFYAMAQAQAGLGNQEKAKKALDIATGLNPTLDFAPASSVASLRQAITPQTAKIETIKESHFWRNFFMGFILFAGGGLIIALYMQKQRKEEEAELSEKLAAQAERDAERKREHMEMLAKQDAERKAELAAEKAAEEALKAHKNYGKPGFDPENPDKLKTKAQLKKEAEALALREAQARAEAAEADARAARLRANYNVGTPSAPAAQTVTHVHQGSGSNDMLTGVLIGNMISNSGHHDHHSHDTTIIRETTREVEAPARAPKSSWDDIGTPAPSKSSSWDDDSSSRSSSRSSSWDSDSSSSSSSSSSWSSSSSSDSGSSWSSSDSGSSSSWD